LFPILPRGPRVELVERLPIESPPEIAHLHATCSQSGHLDSKVFDTISEFFDTQQFQELRWIIANWYFRGIVSKRECRDVRHHKARRRTIGDWL
jgi:hypothetical protein